LWTNSEYAAVNTIALWLQRIRKRLLYYYHNCDYETILVHDRSYEAHTLDTDTDTSTPIIISESE
jgi:hypothetical protein